MAKSFKDLKGEGTIEPKWVCLWCRKEERELNGRGFCSSQCENEYDKIEKEWFDWFTSK